MRHFCQRQRLKFLLSIVYAQLLLALSCSHEVDQNARPVAATTRMSPVRQVELPASQPTGLTLQLFQTRESIQGLDHPWPHFPTVDMDTYDDTREEAVNVKIPDGRMFSLRAHQADIFVYRAQVISVSIWAFDKPKSLAQTIQAAESILAQWNLEPKGGIKTLLEELKAELPNQNQPPAVPAPQPGVTVFRGPDMLLGNSSGGYAGMEVGPDAQVHIDIRPLIGGQDEYSLIMEISAATKWIVATQPHQSVTPD